MAFAPIFWKIQRFRQSLAILTEEPHGQGNRTNRLIKIIRTALAVDN
jgi:hypothetical protein